MVHAQVRAYLAHTFKHRQYIRDFLTPKIHALGISTRNPFYEPDGSTRQSHIARADEYEKQTGMPADYQKVCKEVNQSAQTIVKRDLRYIDHSDLTIAYMTDLSKGTSDEVFYSGVIKRRPVFLLCTDVRLCLHPWLVYECRFGKICHTEEELIKELRKRYG
jgi:hypothetical protein